MVDKRPIPNPIERPIQRPITRPIENPAEKPIIRPIEKPIIRPIENPVEKPIIRPIENPIEKPIIRPIENPVEKPIVKPIENPMENPIAKPIDNPIAKPIENAPIFTPKPTQNAALIEIMQHQFAVYDIALYLDTHPNDMRALEAHKKYTTMLHELIMAYEEIHGPMTLLSHHGDYRKYVNEPWPWEICF